MKYFALSSLFAKILIVLFSTSLADLEHTHDGFLQCLVTRLSPSTHNPQPIIYTPNNPSYYSVLNSSIKNPRFSSPFTPKPYVIVTPFTPTHVQNTVYCSEKHGMQIRTRSGGHDYEGLSYVSKVPFVVIDLRNLSSISVDVESKSAWVQAGATVGELYYRIGEKTGNLGFPAGDYHTVGVGGQIGGGGYGYLARKYGLSADNILDAKFIDAKGRVLDRKSMGKDLFWAIRGGGPSSFGVVLAWKLRLVPVPPIVTVFDVSRNMEDNATRKFVHQWQLRANKVDDDLSIYITFQSNSSIDKEGNKKIILEASSVRATYHGGIDKLLQLMQEEFPELGLQRQECTEMRWVESFPYFNYFRNGESLDALLSRTSYSNLSSFKAKSDYVEKPIPDDVFEGMLRRLLEEEVGQARIDVFPCGGKLDEFPESTIPYPHRIGNLYVIHYLVGWPEEGNLTASKKHITWIRRLYNYMTPYVSKNPRATYINFRDLDIGMNKNEDGHTSTPDNIAKAKIWGRKYFKNNFNKLIRVKTIVDPTNFFTHEQSIPPILKH